MTTYDLGYMKNGARLGSIVYSGTYKVLLLTGNESEHQDN